MTDERLPALCKVVGCACAQGVKRLPAVNGSLEADSIWLACCFSPRRAANPAMTRRDPIVNDRANLEGAITITGRKTEKARIIKTKPAPMKAKKYANCCVFGIRYLQAYTDKDVCAYCVLRLSLRA